MKEPKKKQYNITLDVLRIAACGGVLCTHMWQIYGISGNKMLDLAGKVCHAGANGVVILFCLSGYLAWMGIDRAEFDRGSYWKKRMLRLTPAYFAVLILYLLFGLLPLDFGVMRYFTYTNGIIPSHAFGIYNNKGGLWTMSCFAFFYLLSPFLKKYIHSLRSAVLALAGMFCAGKLFDLALHPLLTMAGADEIVYMEAIFPVGNMYLFLLGIVAYYALKEGKEYAVILAGIVLISLLLMIEKIDYPLWGLIAAVVIILSSKAAWFNGRRNKLTGLIRQGSAISYEVYLSHFLFLEWMKKVEIPLEPLLVLGATAVFSYALHQAVELLNKKVSQRS